MCEGGYVSSAFEFAKTSFLALRENYLYREHHTENNDRIKYNVCKQKYFHIYESEKRTYWDYMASSEQP
jgi:hypothetical protein